MPSPPVAALREHIVRSPHGERIDEYYWLRDDTRSDPDVIGYLKAENAYLEAVQAHVKPLEERIYGEIVARIRQDDASVPYRHRGFWYVVRYETGREYPIHARRPDAPDAPEEVMLDVNALAEGFEFFQVGALNVSPDNRILAYAEDSVGRRQWTIRFKDLATGGTLPDRIVERRSRHRVGRRQPHPVLRREASRDAAGLQGEKARRRHGPRCRSRSSTCRTTRASTRRSAIPRTNATSSSTRAAPSRARCAMRTRTTRARSRCSCRASAIISTTPSTSTAAGSSAPTGRRRTSG